MGTCLNRIYQNHLLKVLIHVFHINYTDHSLFIKHFIHIHHLLNHEFQLFWNVDHLMVTIDIKLFIYYLTETRLFNFIQIFLLNFLG